MEVGASADETDETDETDEAVAALGRAAGPKWYARPGAPLGNPAAATAAYRAVSCNACGSGCEARDSEPERVCVPCQLGAAQGQARSRQLTDELTADELLISH